MTATDAPPDTGRGALRRELTRLDTIFFLVSAMVVVDTIGAIAVAGGQAFTWLVVLFVTFFVPSALVSAELGAALPDEGGAYVWVREAFGRWAGSVTSLLYWAGTPMWLGGSVAVVAMAVWGRFFGELSTTGMVVFGACFVAAATVGAVVPLRWGKWVPTSGAVGQIALLVVFTGTVVGYGAVHGVHGIGLHDLAPTAVAAVAVVPVLLYSFVGVELPSTAGEEMVDPRRDLPVAIARAGVGQALMYGLPILAVLVVLPAGRVTSLHGLVDAMRTVYTVFGGSVTADGTVTLTGAGLWLGRASALVFVWVLLASGSAWIMGAGRAQAAACLDGGGPAVLGRISPRTGVPVVMGLVSGGISLLTTVVDVVVTRGDGQRYFSAALTTSIALIVVAYLFVYPSFLVLRRRRPDLERPFLVPGGHPAAVAVTALATGWSVVATVFLLWPGLGLPDPDAALPAGFAGDRAGFEVLVVAPVLAVVAVASGWHLLARLRRPLLSTSGAGG